MDNEKTFRYLLLSATPAWNAQRLSKGRLGIVKEMPRKRSKKFINRKVGPVFNIKRVARGCDLLLLLFLGNADYIMIHPKIFAETKDAYQSQLHQVGKSKPVLYPQLFIHKSRHPQPLKLQPPSLKALGFSSLKAMPKP